MASRIGQSVLGRLCPRFCGIMGKMGSFPSEVATLASLGRFLSKATARLIETNYPQRHVSGLEI
jgi:hypothetical protein